ncbi:hypothetical protein GWI33_002318 [Rhynchophorus ferrugineus]|uniref:Endonuclease/exonuclease/phosphatase domain-containing protein n=1 Tax=Rhynchophorus ferrugineus TaxID=354439 RepID=A0A834MGF4_RHYFE|nr:hypothetical protein GWI33_002318 [Rhynchophorus ferrugineus]
MAVPKSLILMTWNANSLRGKQAELEDVMTFYHVDIVLIQETFLKPSHRLSFEHFFVYRNDRTPGRGGGTAILVRKGVKHELLPSLSVNNFETTSIKIDIQERPFVITSLYRKSSAFNYAEYRSLVEGKFPKIIGGDFNAHHPTWGCSRANSAGNAIVALSADLGYGLALPDEPTHHPSTVSQGAARILDFFILQDVNRDSEVRVLDELDSDHRPVLLKLGNCATTQVPVTRFRKKPTGKTTNLFS